jgi:hypothetical protein
MSVKVIGYSERGTINSILYEMKYSPEGLERLREFLGLSTFPFESPKPDFKRVQHATIIVEQSFSDFGDPDVLFLLDDADGRKHSVFLEAKVKTCQKGVWLITDEWSKFISALHCPTDKVKSNLFVQLYRKLQLVRHAKGQKLDPDVISRRWRIGTNNVVLRAARILAPYAMNSEFLALVPDSPDNVARFFSEKLASPASEANRLPAWQKDRMGYLTWSQVEARCRENPASWSGVLENFRYNLGQILVQQSQPPIIDRTIIEPLPPPPAYLPRLKDVCQLTNGRAVVIVNPGTNNHRYRFLENGLVNPISQSFLASTTELHPTGQQYQGQVQPEQAKHYLFQGQQVVVVKGGPERSRVRSADSNEPSFLVLDHELQQLSGRQV